MSPLTALMLIYVCAIIGLGLSIGVVGALCMWLMIGSHSIILLLALERKGVIKL